MKKYGKIPPHFLYYLENEGIKITDLKSSNLSLKELYDRMIVKLPFSTRTLDIQIIFDNLNCSVPPDFLFVKEENFLMDYNEIIKDWNFKDSSTLYNSLAKLKLIYSLNQEIKLKEEVEKFTKTNNTNIKSKDDDFNYSEIVEIWKNIQKIYLKIKNKTKNFKNIHNKNKCFYKANSLDEFNINEVQSIKDDNSNCEIIVPEINFNLNTQNDFTDYKNFVTISYPLDIPIRSRNIPRYPHVNLTYYFNYEMKFKLELSSPNFVNIQNFKIKPDLHDMRNHEYTIDAFETSVIDYFKDMNFRELIINRIINMNLGFTLEVDSLGFRKLVQYIFCNENLNITKKNEITPNLLEKKNSKNNIVNNSMSLSALSMSSIQNVFYFNLVVCYNFDKDDAKVLNAIIIDSDKLSTYNQKKFSFNNTEKDLEILINSIFEFVINNVQNKFNS